jgi:hypothetical protein
MSADRPGPDFDPDVTADVTPQAAAPGPQDRTARRPILEGPGARIGPYKFLQQLGEGGMGVIANLPAGLVDRFPRDLVLDWLECSVDRAHVLVHLVAANFADDRSLAAHLADLHGDQEQVSFRLFRQIVETVEMGTMLDERGPWSARWAAKAAELEQLARSTQRPGLRRWAQEAAEELRELESSYRLREQEETAGY